MKSEVITLVITILILIPVTFWLDRHSGIVGTTCWNVPSPENGNYTCYIIRNHLVVSYSDTSILEFHDYWLYLSIVITVNLSVKFGYYLVTR